jgi:hypothetical protein
MSTFDREPEDEEEVSNQTSMEALIEYLSRLDVETDEHMKELYKHVCGLVDTANEIYGPGQDNPLKEESLLKLSRFIRRKSKGELSGGMDKKGRVDQELLCEQIRQFYEGRPGTLIQHLNMNTIPLDWKKMIVAALAMDTKGDPEERALLIRSLKNLSQVNKEFYGLVKEQYIGNDGLLASEGKRSIHEFFVSILGFDCDATLCSGYSILTTTTTNEQSKKIYSCSIQMRQFQLTGRQYLQFLNAMEPGKRKYTLHSNPKVFEVRVTNRIAKILDALNIKKTISLPHMNREAQLHMDKRLTAGESINYWHRNVGTPLFPVDPETGIFHRTRTYRNVPFEHDASADEEVLWRNSYKRYYKVTREEIDQVMLTKAEHLLDVLNDVNIDEADTMNHYCLVDMATMIAILEYLSESGEIDLINDNALVVANPTYSNMVFGVVLSEETDAQYGIDREIDEVHEEEFNILIGAIDVPRGYKYWDETFNAAEQTHMGNISYLLTRSCLTQENGTLFVGDYTNGTHYPRLIIGRLTVVDNPQIDWVMYYKIRDGPCISFRENFLPLSTRGAWRRTLKGSENTKRIFREQLKMFDIPPADITTKRNINNNNNNNNNNN